MAASYTCEALADALANRAARVSRCRRPFWVEAGFAAFALNTRYLNNDATMLHEALMLDLAAAVKFLREEEGLRNVVALGSIIAVPQVGGLHHRYERLAP